MRIPEFRVTNQRAIQLAECHSVPSVMIVTGPNGCGKSTLLQALRTARGGARPMYIGPHRASRRQRVRFRNLGPEIRMSNVLTEDELPGYEGIRNVATSRTPWDQDDAASLLKYGLCQIELDWREAVSARYRTAGEISKDSLPDVWKPLREMTENLLPHLSFEAIDTKNKDEIKCFWKVSSSSSSIDFDDLSSGEKSIIQTFFPLVEHRIRRSLKELEGGSAADQHKESGSEHQSDSICVLIDEPELHLHPNLQVGMLDYFRALAIREGAQCIIATHSPIIVENANSEELYLLRPKDMLNADENQLVQIANNEEKLQLLRAVFGLTSNLTAMRPILVVEGKQEDRQSKRAADARIYTLLSEEFGRLTILPAGGKSECRSLAMSLNGILSDFARELKAHALLDRDLEGNAAETQDGEYLLPVSMIENFLLDPKIIWKATKLVHHKMALKNEEDVEEALVAILDDSTEDEVGRRVKARVGIQVFRLKDPVESSAEQVREFVRILSEEFTRENISSITSACRDKVLQITKEESRRELFHGKRMLDEFDRLHMHDTGMSKEIFIYACAECARERQSVKEFVENLMRSVGSSE